MIIYLCLHLHVLTKTQTGVLGRQVRQANVTARQIHKIYMHQSGTSVRSICQQARIYSEICEAKVEV
jgi:hypothetical protein